MGEKLDLFRLHAREYRASQDPVLIETLPAGYLSITGRGEPGQTEFIASLEALYSVAFAVKTASRARGEDYAVCKLEGLWWAAESQDGDAWAVEKLLNWKLMIRTPDFIVSDRLQEAASPLLQLKKGPEVKSVKLERIHEGVCVQMLHRGSYGNEKESVDKMRLFAKEKGFRFDGLHHEIYLSDPRRVPEDRLRTLLRRPVTRRKKDDAA